jgi:hypothetical protein
VGSRAKPGVEEVGRLLATISLDQILMEIFQAGTISRS